MATRKPKADGLQALVAKQDPVSIQELTMQDFFAAFALQGLLAHYGDRGVIENDDGVTSIHAAAMDHADEMLFRRAM
jgi:hypothetical protein